PLLQKNTVLKSISLNRLDLDITRKQDESYDVLQLLGSIGKNKIPTLSNLADLNFNYSLNNISISNATFKLTDVPSGKVHQVEKIQLDLPTVANIPIDVKQFLRPHFSAIVNGSPIELSAQTKDYKTKDQDGVTKLSLNIQELDLPQYAGYLPIDLPMQISKGKADGK
ncbi:MAG: DUF748 domain-containing protein, partial [Proteobacteria bacterium]|nr:DUF748 domain-containing protein [Pseudomonadota bacterium]